MALDVEIPGRDAPALAQLVLDVNGTLTDRGALIDHVAERVARLGESVRVHLLSAGTFGTLDLLLDERALRATLRA